MRRIRKPAQRSARRLRRAAGAASPLRSIRSFERSGCDIKSSTSIVSGDLPVTAAMPTTKPAFVWEDPLLLEELLSDDERMVRDSARAYCQEKLMPRVIEANRHEKFDR